MPELLFASKLLGPGFNICSTLPLPPWVKLLPSDVNYLSCSYSAMHRNISHLIHLDRLYVHMPLNSAIDAGNKYDVV